MNIELLAVSGGPSLSRAVTFRSLARQISDEPKTEETDI